MDFIKINGVTLPVPTTCSISEYDIDSASTGRGESAYMMRERIRGNVCKIDLAWNGASPADAKAIRAAIADAFFEVTVWFLGEERTMTMYAGDRSYTPHFTDHNGEKLERWDISFSLTEQ
ncbi:MAG: hypothetical protein ACI4J3_07420 [Oscillospiraceae bacterium]